MTKCHGIRTRGWLAGPFALRCTSCSSCACACACMHVALGSQTEPHPHKTFCLCALYMFNLLNAKWQGPRDKGLLTGPLPLPLPWGAQVGTPPPMSNVRTGEGVHSSAPFRGDGHGARRPACATPLREAPLHFRAILPRETRTLPPRLLSRRVRKVGNFRWGRGLRLVVSELLHLRACSCYGCCCVERS